MRVSQNVTLFYVLRMYYVLRSLGTAKRNTSAKQCYVLRDPHLRFGSYAVEIIITFCVKLLRFGLSYYVLGNVTFCGPTTVPPKAGRFASDSVTQHAKEETIREPIVEQTATRKINKPVFPLRRYAHSG